MTCFFTNLVLFFAGTVTVLMPYPMNNFYFVVLIFCTHSNGREAGIGTNMEIDKQRQQLGSNDFSWELCHVHMQENYFITSKIVNNLANTWDIQL